MKPIPRQTTEEADFVKEYMLLPLMLDVLERDRSAMDLANLKMSEVYGGLIGLLQKAATDDLSRVRKSMREHGMKVYEERRTSIGIEARYLCRGYHYEFSMLWGLIRAEIMQRLCCYLGIDIAEKGIFS
ncbi:hypothetical protein SAMN04488542_105186 [Fontibacillus panacisegetis]|uniref:Uncharacterized protein n=1 Tax=Fontibacillus panacisegetis TaxID=670482 RepID=A0A1G7I7P9_9BACL|nr:hypothetical protein [Fontibacillus panacisegetis]SDF08740.1 hypothetical protein SAMN04488542_105186 [Fontibacillus panacisegetis]